MIYTIGYGGSKPDEFFGFIEATGIEIVIDVRSKPHGFLQVYSNPTIGKKLFDMGIDYKHDPRLGGLDMIDQDAFEIAIDEVMELSKNSRVLLMCSEKDPKKCHRHSKLSPKLEEQGAEMRHLVIHSVPKHEKRLQTTLF